MNWFLVICFLLPCSHLAGMFWKLATCSATKTRLCNWTLNSFGPAAWPSAHSPTLQIQCSHRPHVLPSVAAQGEMGTPGVPQLKLETQWEWKLKPSIFEMTASPVAAWYLKWMMYKQSNIMRHGITWGHHQQPPNHQTTGPRFSSMWCNSDAGYTRSTGSWDPNPASGTVGSLGWTFPCWGTQFLLAPKLRARSSPEPESPTSTPWVFWLISWGSWDPGCVSSREKILTSKTCIAIVSVSCWILKLCHFSI